MQSSVESVEGKLHGHAAPWDFKLPSPAGGRCRRPFEGYARTVALHCCVTGRTQVRSAGGERSDFVAADPSSRSRLRRTAEVDTLKARNDELMQEKAALCARIYELER